MIGELLAPAGNLEKLKCALDFGADAVYLGGKDYSLRANAANFTNEELIEGITYAHNLNKKIYVTVNMLFHNKDFENVKEYLIFLDKIKVDGVLISDFGIISVIKELKLNLKLMTSTQESSTNYKALEFYKRLGIDRVVLARECSREDIAEMKKRSDLEIEVFIHGAMCTSYSGRCVLSNYITKRDSNRGGCAQVCRFEFNLDNREQKYAISSKDLNMIDYVPDLINMKIDSFKIEGRMKSVYYIATVVDAYRHIIDKTLNKTLTKEDINYYKMVLNRCANRENVAQFYDKKPTYKEQYYTGRKEVSNQDFLGIVLSYDENNKKAVIEQRNNFKKGAKVDIFGSKTEVFSFTITSLKNRKGENVDDAKHPQEILEINVPKPVNKGDIIRVNLLDN